MVTRLFRAYREFVQRKNEGLQICALHTIWFFNSEALDHPEPNRDTKVLQ